MGIRIFNQQTEEVYRALLKRARWNPPDLVAQSPRDDSAVVDDICALQNSRMVAPSADEPGFVRAIEPRLALPTLVARQFKTGDASELVAAPSVIQNVIEQHEGFTSIAPGWHVGGLDRAAVLVERLVATGRRELIFTTPVYIPHSFEHAPYIAELARRKGMKVKMLWTSALGSLPALTSVVQELMDMGCEIRISKTLMDRAVIVDRSVAINLSDPDSVHLYSHEDRVTDLASRSADHWNSAQPVRRAVYADTPRNALARHEVILGYLAEGLTDESIASKLEVSIRTVRSDIAKTMSNLDAKSRFQAGVAASRIGIV